jgi:hypothetical protein
MSEVTEWQPERGNWSTTRESEFIPGKQCGDPRQGNWVDGWVTVPENGLSPDCEPVDGTCACGRRAE